MRFPPAPATNISLLFNISADPGEHTDLSTQFPEVVNALKAKVADLSKEVLAACNIDGGSCSSDDPNFAAVLKRANAWVPWVADPKTEDFVNVLV